MSSRLTDTEVASLNAATLNGASALADAAQAWHSSLDPAVREARLEVLGTHVAWLEAELPQFGRPLTELTEPALAQALEDLFCSAPGAAQCVVLGKTLRHILDYIAHANLVPSIVLPEWLQSLGPSAEAFVSVDRVPEMAREQAGLTSVESSTLVPLGIDSTVGRAIAVWLSDQTMSQGDPFNEVARHTACARLTSATAMLTLADLTPDCAVGLLDDLYMEYGRRAVPALRATLTVILDHAAALGSFQRIRLPEWPHRRGQMEP